MTIIITTNLKSHNTLIEISIQLTTPTNSAHQPSPEVSDGLKFFPNLLKLHFLLGFQCGLVCVHLQSLL